MHVVTTPTAAATAAAASSAVLSSRGRYYTKTHEWFEVEDEGVGIVGITQLAQRALGEVVFCRLPQVGDRFKVMDTLATLEAVKAVGEVKSPVYGEVLEVNTRLQREPALVTHAPLSSGWLVRLGFNGKIPKYLQRTRAVARADVEPLLADPEALQAFFSHHLLLSRVEEEERQEGTAEGLRELTFDGLTSQERALVHVAAEAVGLATASQGSGRGRQLFVRRAFKEQAEEEDEELEMEMAEGERRMEKKDPQCQEKEQPRRQDGSPSWKAARFV